MAVVTVTVLWKTYDAPNITNGNQKLPMFLVPLFKMITLNPLLAGFTTVSVKLLRSDIF